MRSASRAARPERIAASAMTASAVSTLSSPAATISPALHAAQKARLLRSPTLAPATRRTRRASAQASANVTRAVCRHACEGCRAPISVDDSLTKPAICCSDTAGSCSRLVAPGAPGDHAKVEPLGWMPNATNCWPRPRTSILPRDPATMRGSCLQLRAHAREGNTSVAGCQCCDERFLRTRSVIVSWRAWG